MPGSPVLAGWRDELAERPLDVVCVGNALVDHLVFAAPELVIGAGLRLGGMTLVDLATTKRLRQTVGEGRQVPGGTVTNTAVGVASLGGRPAFVGAVATDELGARYESDLEAAGVRAVLEHFPADPKGEEAATGQCYVLVTPDAERTMATALGAGGQLDRHALDRIDLAEAALVYFDGYLLELPDAEALVERLLADAEAAGTPVALGLADAWLVERHHDVLSKLVSGPLSLVFANEAEAIVQTGAATVELAVEALGRPGLAAVVTRGAAGALVSSDGELVHVPAEPVGDVVDATGAGDLFAAGFCYGVTHELDLTTSARLAALAAGEVIGHLGARPEQSLAKLAQAHGLL